MGLYQRGSTLSVFYKRKPARIEKGKPARIKTGKPARLEKGGASLGGRGSRAGCWEKGASVEPVGVGAPRREDGRGHQRRGRGQLALRVSACLPGEAGLFPALCLSGIQVSSPFILPCPAALRLQVLQDSQLLLFFHYLPGRPSASSCQSI